MAVAYLTNAQFTEQASPIFSGVPSTAITNAIVWASATADSFLRKRFNLPLVFKSDLSDLDPALTQNVLFLAQWKLATQVGFRPGSGQNEVIVDQYKDAMEWLLNLSKGLVEISCVDQTPDVDEDGAQVAGDAPMSWRVITGPQP